MKWLVLSLLVVVASSHLIAQSELPASNKPQFGVALSGNLFLGLNNGVDRNIGWDGPPYALIGHINPSFSVLSGDEDQLHVFELSRLTFNRNDETFRRVNLDGLSGQYEKTSLKTRAMFGMRYEYSVNLINAPTAKKHWRLFAGAAIQTGFAMSTLGSTVSAQFPMQRNQAILELDVQLKTQYVLNKHWRLGASLYESFAKMKIEQTILEDPSLTHNQQHSLVSAFHLFQYLQLKLDLNYFF